MYTDIRKRILTTIFLVLGLIVLLLVAYFVLKNRKPPEDTTLPPATDAPPSFTDSSSVSPEQFIITPPPKTTNEPGEPDALYAKQTARLFVERFASYSNQNDNVHIENVLPMVTETMAAWVKTQQTEPSEVYEGLVTTVVASTVSSYSSTGAEVRVDVQQAVDDTGEKRTEYKTGRVVLVKVGSEWKVDALYWE